jgi:hypothetical protein
MSQHGRVSGRWPTKELNKVSDELIDLLGGNIPMEAEYKAGKEVQIQLTKAVALENNRGSITAAQKAGRKTKTTRPGPGSGSKSESESESESGLETEPVDVQDSSLRLQPRRQPQIQVSPDLPAAEPVKKTRKRRALVEDHEEVDIGPRKLRSRK